MQNNNRTLKKVLQKPEQSNMYVFPAKCNENVVLSKKNAVNKIECAEVKKKKRWQPHASHYSYTC